MEVISLFPSVVHRLDPSPDFKHIKDDLIDFCYKEKKKDTKGRSVSNIGGWQSEILKVHNDPISSFIGDSIYPYLHKLMNSWVNLRVTNAWININKKGDFNSTHIHPRVDLAGVFYLKVPEKSGDLKFVSPHEYSYFGEFNCYVREFIESLNHAGAFWIEPKEGEIFIFPSSLYHEVTPSESRQDRISVGFNIKLGDKRFPNW